MTGRNDKNDPSGALRKKSRKGGVTKVDNSWSKIQTSLLETLLAVLNCLFYFYNFVGKSFFSKNHTMAFLTEIRLPPSDVGFFSAFWYGGFICPFDVVRWWLPWVSKKIWDGLEFKKKKKAKTIWVTYSFFFFLNLSFQPHK